MKLVTFQTIDAVKELINNGYLECNENFINLEKAQPTYNWVFEKMSEQIPNKYNAKYPLWCWVKFKNTICPPKHKMKSANTFDTKIKITFNKSPKEVFITDYRRYSFLLNNTYIPENKFDKERFDKELMLNNITDEELKAFVRPDKYPSHRTDKVYLSTCDKIRKSFDRCITNKSDVLQGCVWRIDFSEVECIEVLSDNNFCYGSFNYLRSNGKRFNWREDFYRTLK